SFKTEYHPKSSCPPVTKSFSTYGQTSAATPPIVDQEPWQPYLSHLNHLIWKVADGPLKFSFKFHSDAVRAWEQACTQMTPHHAVPIHYKKELEFNMYTQPLWDWAMDMLQDPLLVPHFMWDVQYLYKYNGECVKQFIHEPWTADQWWNIQSMLPRENSTLFVIILYMDKTHLSPPGGVKGYPVTACCANLPVGTQNSDGISWGHIVGWLPIV
ncbi:hypothetical protein PAXRUDRAFT_91038, partial [Paxillus rubicundulus Ve08.2h10]